MKTNLIYTILISVVIFSCKTELKTSINIPNSNYLGVINQPNARGLPCDYQDLAIDLGTGICTEGLPQRLPFMNLNGQDPTKYFDARISINDGGCANEPIAFSINTNERIERVIWCFDDESVFETLEMILTVLTCCSD